MFNVRDLMANLATKSPGGAEQLFLRCAVTWEVCCDTGGSGCGFSGGGCGQLGIGYTCDVGNTRLTYFLAAAATDPEVQKHQMAALKAQLKAAVAEIEKQEEAVGKR
jgi:hypothetical protein